MLQYTKTIQCFEEEMHFQASMHQTENPLKSAICKLGKAQSLHSEATQRSLPVYTTNPYASAVATKGVECAGLFESLSSLAPPAWRPLTVAT